MFTASSNKVSKTGNIAVDGKIVILEIMALLNRHPAANQNSVGL